MPCRRSTQRSRRRMSRNKPHPAPAGFLRHCGNNIQSTSGAASNAKMAVEAAPLLSFANWDLWMQRQSLSLGGRRRGESVSLEDWRQTWRGPSVEWDKEDWLAAAAKPEGKCGAELRRIVPIDAQSHRQIPICKNLFFPIDIPFLPWYNHPVRKQARRPRPHRKHQAKRS